jgi:hypothetical protein
MKQFFSLLFLFVFVSGLSFAQNQPTVDKNAFSVLNPKPHIINPTNDTPLEEVFGLNQNTFGPAGLRGRGNIFLCTTSRKLVEHRLYLNPAAGTNLWFVVYEGATFNGTYNLVNSVNFPGSGPGEGWYSSGPIDFDLQAGMYYMIYVLFDLNANYYNQQNISPYPIDCSFGQLVSGVGWNWSPVFNSPPNATETPTEVELSGVAYYQTIVTDDIPGGAPFFDDFDSYLAGEQLACQNPADWTTWSNLPCDPTEDAYISSNYSYSGANSCVIVQNNDLVKLHDMQTTGQWYTSFLLYIPAGKSGYFNQLTTFTPNPNQWGVEVYFDAGGAGRVVADVTTNFTWQEDTWQQAVLLVDLDTHQATFWFGSSDPLNMIYTWDWTRGGTYTNEIDANDFFGAAATDEMYMDNYYFDNAMPPIIPVELTSFTAISNNGAVELNWQTATEVNNHMFEIERKAEGSEFRTIGFVEGHGTTTEPQSYSYIDNEVQRGTYVYRLKQIDFNGTFKYSNEVEVDATGPLTFSLGQNYPNPFNPSTKINYKVPEAGNVKLAVYNIVGEEVAVLVNGFTQAGSFDVTFNASNLPSGVYLYKLQSANSVQTKKMLLLK